MRCPCWRSLLWCTLTAMAYSTVFADDGVENIAELRIALMRDRIAQIRFVSNSADFPKTLQPEPLFRYDDLTRGYVDGTVWRLGATGRPHAIVTVELHPNYGGGGPRAVYDLLSLSSIPFAANSPDLTWTPFGSAVEWLPVVDAPPPADTDTRRLFQMKQMASRFTATQNVEGQAVPLRLLPKPIDRYQPSANETSDGVIFLLVNGRNPALVLLLETDGNAWSYAIGRLSHPSVISVSLDDAANVIWSQEEARLASELPYTALNAPASIPGFK